MSSGRCQGAAGTLCQSAPGERGQFLSGAARREDAKGTRAAPAERRGQVGAGCGVRDRLRGAPAGCGARVRSGGSARGAGPGQLRGSRAIGGARSNCGGPEQLRGAAAVAEAGSGCGGAPGRGVSAAAAGSPAPAHAAAGCRRAEGSAAPRPHRPLCLSCSLGVLLYSLRLCVCVVLRNEGCAATATLNPHTTTLRRSAPPLLQKARPPPAKIE